MHDPRIPVTVITGFLGAGKTTLLNRLVKHPDLAHSALLINEVGEIPIDHLLVDKIDESVVVLDSGCLCCTVNGDLHRALWSLFKSAQCKDIPRLDRIVIETSGLADPTPLVYSLIKDPLLMQRFRCDGVLTVVDTLNAETTLTHFEEWMRQVTVADRLLLSKTDIATPADRERIVARLRTVNPFASIVDISGETLTPATLLAIGGTECHQHPDHVLHWLGEHGTDAHHDESSPEQRAVIAHAHDHSDDHGAEHVHTSGIDVVSLRFAEPFSWGALSQCLDTLLTTSGDQILRVKGLVAVSGDSQPRTIHCVRHLRYPATMLTAWPSDDQQTRMVFITRNYPRAYLIQAFEIFCNQTPLEMH